MTTTAAHNSTFAAALLFMAVAVAVPAVFIAISQVGIESEVLVLLSAR